MLLTLTQSMISWAVFSPPVVARQALTEMGLDPVWIGAQTTILFVAGMFAAILVSPWVPRLNPMRATQIFVACGAVGGALIATGSIFLAALGSIVIGTGLGPATPASSHILARVTPRHLLPLIFSIRQSGVPVGGVLAGFVTPLLADRWDWQTALFVVAAACAAMAALVQLWVGFYAAHAEPAREARIEIIAPLRLLLASRPLRWLTLGCIPMVIAQYALTTFLVLYLQEDIDLSVVTAGWVLGAAQASGGVGRLTFGFVAGRYLAPRHVLILLAFLAVTACVLTALLSGSWPLLLIYAVGILFGAGAAGWNGVYLAETARLAPPGGVSRVIGGITFVIFAAVVLGPLAFAGIIELVSFPVAYLCMAALVLTSVVSFLKSRQLAGAG